MHGVAWLDLMMHGGAHRVLDLWLAAVYVLDVVAFLAHKNTKRSACAVKTLPKGGPLGVPR